jgi:hypothetical protein
MPLFTSERSKEEIQEKKKAKIKPYELNQYNPCATRNVVNAKPVF